MPSDRFRQRNPKNKQTKFKLVFDEDSRRDFLTGFQKRKKARKKIAQQEVEEKRKEERRQERQKRRDALEEELRNIRLPDLESKPAKKKAVTYDHPEHTVTVTSVTSLDLKKEHGGIGDNEVEYEDDVDNDQSSDDNDDEEIENGEEESDQDMTYKDNDDDGDDNDHESEDAIKQRLEDDADDDHHGKGEESKIKDAKSKKKALFNKRRQAMKQQAARKKRGVSQATVRRMKSMKRKSLGKFMKRGSGRKKPRR